MAIDSYDLSLTHWHIDLSGKEYENTIMGKLSRQGWFGRCLAFVSPYEIKAVKEYIKQFGDDVYMSRIGTLDEWWDQGNHHMLYMTQSFEIFFKNLVDHDNFINSFLPSLPARICYILIPAEEYHGRLIKNKKTLNHLIINNSVNDFVIIHTEQRNDLVELKLRWS